MSQKRSEAVLRYMRLTGAQRCALQIMLGVERAPQRQAYETCVAHIETALSK